MFVKNSVNGDKHLMSFVYPMLRLWIDGYDYDKNGVATMDADVVVWIIFYDKF